MFITPAERQRVTRILATYLPTIDPSTVILNTGIGSAGWVIQVSVEFTSGSKRNKFTAYAQWKDEEPVRHELLERHWHTSIEKAVRESLKKQGYLMPIADPDDPEDGSISMELVTYLNTIKKAAL